MFSTPERQLRRRLPSIVPLLAIVAVVSSCTTTPERTSGGIVVEANDDITITVRHYSATELRDRYTSRNNPFIAPLMLFTPVELLVFDMTIETTDPSAIIDTSEIELLFAGERYLNLTPRSLLRFWEGTGVYNDLEGQRRVRFERLINRELVTRPPVEKNGAAAGLAVFRARRFPEEGRLSIEVPVTSLSTGRTTRHRITLRLSTIAQE